MIPVRNKTCYHSHIQLSLTHFVMASICHKIYGHIRKYRLIQHIHQNKTQQKFYQSLTVITEWFPNSFSVLMPRGSHLGRIQSIFAAFNSLASVASTVSGEVAPSESNMYIWSLTLIFFTFLLFYPPSTK